MHLPSGQLNVVANPAMPVVGWTGKRKLAKKKHWRDYRAAAVRSPGQHNLGINWGLFPVLLVAS